ncbi:ubiquinone biosynthesis protein [Favolaschia claudopus]|uniref:Ubiquinone biosynthesis protein n=1 Tax=Favolaschia claudopus TaxID=2862362 RepID=A0AAW0AT10_9AGAR
MAAPSSARLLKLALPLISEHGFTRVALSRSVLHLPTPHPEPLSDAAVSALFGHGNVARKTLFNAWLEGGIENMQGSTTSASVKEALHARLAYNDPVLEHLPEAFALLAVPESGLPPIDPVPALKHAARVAEQACHISGDPSNRLNWYTKRATLMGIYSAAELHQLNSPKTAHSFLDTLLSTSATINSSVEEVKLFSSYILRSWAGIVRSRDIL